MSRKLRLPLKSLVGGCLAGLVLVVGVQAYHVVLGGNFHSVIEGDLYRCAQPSAEQLEGIIRSRRVRTVINLRGDNDGEGWYHEEKATAARLGARFVDVGLWAKHPPLAEELALLVDALAEAKGPVLVHCYQGGDRAGLASALGVLLRTGAGLGEARGQLALHYGHNVFGMARCLGRVLDCYEEWLRANGLSHAPAHLRRWAREGYRREACY